MQQRKLDLENMEKAEEQIQRELQVVRFKVVDYPVEVIVQKFLEDKEEEQNEIFIPEYQREFVWKASRQSKFIESVLIGLPIPYIFVADNDGRLEVVDGTQRIRTLAAFISDELVLTDMKKLDLLNGCRYSDLLISRRRRFNRSDMRVVVLMGQATEMVKIDIFERINTGSDILAAMEVRKGMLKGKFYEILDRCSGNNLFKELCPISKKRLMRQEDKELVLRFFAYMERYQEFQHDVTEFLSKYMSDMNKRDDDFSYEIECFNRMLSYAKRNLPYGFAKAENYKSTPRVRFEALSVGIGLAIRENEGLEDQDVTSWLESKEFARHTRSDASNSRPRLTGRIEFVRDKLLGL